MSQEDKDDSSHEQRKRFAIYLERNHLVSAKLAKLAGLTTPNVIYNFTRGRTKHLSYNTLMLLDKVAPGIADFVLARGAEVVKSSLSNGQAFPGEASVFSASQQADVPNRSDMETCFWASFAVLKRAVRAGDSALMRIAIQSVEASATALHSGKKPAQSGPGNSL